MANIAAGFDATKKMVDTIAEAYEQTDSMSMDQAKRKCAEANIGYSLIQWLRLCYVLFLYSYSIGGEKCYCTDLFYYYSIL